MVDRSPSRDYSEDGSAVFVNGQEEISLRIQVDAVDVLTMRERQCVARVSTSISMRLGPKARTPCTPSQVKDRYAISNRRQQGFAIWGEDEVASSIDSAQNV